MKGMRWDLACFNVGRLNSHYDSEQISEFRSALGRMNGIAENSSGFVWMYDSNFSASSTKRGIPELDNDPFLMPQLSLWKDYASLRKFVLKSDHSEFIRRRREWFEKIEGPYVVCWYRDSSLAPPNLQEAFEMLHHLKENGKRNGKTFDFKDVKHIPSPPTHSE